MKKKIIITYKPLKKGLGYWNCKTAEIVVASNQSQKDKDIILIHECLHAVAEMLKQKKIIKKLPDHRFIENTAINLLHLLILAGKWKSGGLKTKSPKPKCQKR
jgi:hypothetical protein